jgi:hypothetical protein
VGKHVERAGAEVGADLYEMFGPHERDCRSGPQGRAS